ncbi:DNA-directed RNA polymerase subunit beta' [Bienertia sinuspersici]
MGVHDFVGAPMIAFHEIDAIRTHTRKVAKSTICSGKDINWVIIAPNDTTIAKYVDDNMQSQQVTDFFLSIRSCFLTLMLLTRCSRRTEASSGEDHSACSIRNTLFIFYSCSWLEDELKSYKQLTSLWKSIYSSSIDSLNFPCPPKSSEDRRSKSQKRKVDNNPSHNKDAKATHDSYRKGPLKIRLTRGSSTCSPKEPAIQSTKGDQSRSPNQSSKDGKSSKDKDKTIIQDIFDGIDSCGDTLSDEEQKGLQGDASIADELRAIHNGFAPIAQELIDVMDDPVTIYAATIIIEETSDIIHDVPLTSMGTPSFSARGIISSAESYAVCFMVNWIWDRLLATPLCDIHGLDNEFKELFDNINAKNIDVPGLEEHVANYIQHALSFCTLKKKHKGRSSVQDLKAQLSSLESRLKNAAYSQRKDEEQIHLQRARMDEIQQRRDDLRKELLQLDEEESKISSLLASSEDSLKKHVTMVKDFTDSHTSLEKYITIAKEAATGS